MTDDIATNPSAKPHFLDAVSRRGFLQGVVAFVALSQVSLAALQAVGFGAPQAQSIIDPSYEEKILLKWGDPLFKNAPKFKPVTHTAIAQTQQFGFNNDYTAVLPLAEKSNSPYLTLSPSSFPWLFTVPVLFLGLRRFG